MRRTPSMVTVLMTAVITLTACSDDSPENGSGGLSTPSATASASGSPSVATSSTPTRASGTTVDITIKDGKVTPNGDRIKAEIGEPVALNIEAERAGELHVHSTPEQKIEYPAGTSSKKLTIDTPGIVDVEEHELGQVIVQLQVS